MFTTIIAIIKKYLGLIDDIFVDFLSDLKSLRYQLVIWAFILNFYVLDLVKNGKADYKLAGVTIGLLTIVYTLYFASKHHQSVMENQNKLSEKEAEPDSDEKAGDAN